MSKILILASKQNTKKQKFVELVRKNFKNTNTEITISLFSEIYVELSQGSILLKIDGKDITSYDLVYMRGVSGGGIFTATLTAICLEAIGIKYFDTLYGKSGPHRTKLGSLALLAKNGISIPKTAFFADQKNSDHFDELSKTLKLPFVAKEMSLQRGKGVHLIRVKSDMSNLPQKSESGSSNQFFFQEFIDKDREYRVLTLADGVGVWEEKIRMNVHEFRNNVALGATEVFFNKKEIPNDIAEAAIASSKALDIQVGGVDVMTERKTGKVYVLEVNRGPGLTYDENVSPEFKEMAEFLENQAK